MARRSVALAVALGLAAAACTGGGSPRPTASPPRSPSSSPSARRGGEAIFGAEAWPQCINPITACALNQWTFMTVLQHVLPRAMAVSPNGTFVASPLLEEQPTMANGGLTQSPFTVTYRIRPDAVWDDGSPVTSADFDFTWRALMSSSGSIWADQYRKIQAIDTPEPKRLVLRFVEPYAPWPELLGGSFGFILKAAAFPDLVDDPHPDLSGAMEGRIPFSGGPFKLQSWTSDEAVLVRNDRYFGSKALLDRVTFIPASGYSPEDLQDFLLGKLDAMAPSFEVGRPLSEVSGLTGVRGKSGPGVASEALWFNLRSPPLTEPEVRLALAYAVDRREIVDKLLRPTDDRAAVLNCGLVALPGVGPWCATQPFSRFEHDPEEARSYLRNAGYDCSKAICAKGGKRLQIDYGLYATSPFQSTVADLIRRQARAAGIALRLQTGGSLVFGRLLCPPPHFAVMGCARAASIDPSIIGLASCDETSKQTNKLAEQNAIGWCNQTVEMLIQQADRELDPDRRRELMEQVYEMEANEIIGLPLFVIPSLSLWRDWIDGPVGAYSSTVYGMYFNMDQWYLVQR